MIILSLGILVLLYVLSGVSPVYLNPFIAAGSRKPTIIAHRGASGLFPENTLAAFQGALNTAASRIELDVQLTKDGEIVVVHDAYITNASGNRYFIRQSTLAQLREAKQDLPVINEVLGMVNGKKELLIEVKKYDDYSPAIEQKLLQAINDHHGKQWCILQSFHDDILTRLRSRDKDVRLGKLLICTLPFTELVIDGQGQFSRLSAYDFVEELSAYHVFTTRHLVQTAARYNKRLNVWTTNNKEVIQKFAALGVDGVITDHP